MAVPQWMVDFRCDAVILADGEYPAHPFPLSLLSAAPFLCCCDGAGKRLVGQGITPHAIVGDGDSLSADFKAEHADIIHIVEEQDFNDLTKATRFTLGQLQNVAPNIPSPVTICYLACTGKREDHTMGNIFLMPYYFHTFHIQPMLLTDYGIFIPARGNRTFASFPRQQVSVFNIDCVQLSSENLKWQAYPAREMWQGTLNESLADTFTIHADGEYMIFQTYDPKDAAEIQK